MHVADIKGGCEAQNLQQLESLLARRIAIGVNSFWLAVEDEQFPKLAILVVNDLAALHFFPNEGSAGYRSNSRSLILPGESTKFCISEFRADDVEVLNDAVLPFSAALTAAKEFFLTGDLPQSIDWFEL